MRTRGECGPVRRERCRCRACGRSRINTGHEPYPALVVDLGWNLVEANASVGLFLQGVAPELLAPPANALRISPHPGGMGPRIVNLGEWRAHLLGRLRRQIALTASSELSQLYEELRSYPCDQPESEVELPGPGEVVVPLRLGPSIPRGGQREQSNLSAGRQEVSRGHPGIKSS